MIATRYVTFLISSIMLTALTFGITIQAAKIVESAKKIGTLNNSKEIASVEIQSLTQRQYQDVASMAEVQYPAFTFSVDSKAISIDAKDVTEHKDINSLISLLKSSSPGVNWSFVELCISNECGVKMRLKGTKFKIVNENKGA